MAPDQVQTHLDRQLPDGRRVGDLTYEEMYYEDCVELLTEDEHLAWAAHEGAKPENVAWREAMRRRREQQDRAREPELPIISQETITDDYGTHEHTVRLLPDGRPMVVSSVSVHRPLSDAEHADLDRNVRQYIGRSLASYETRHETGQMSQCATHRTAQIPRQRQRGAGGRPPARRTHTTTSSSASSGDDSDGPAAPPAPADPPSLAPSSLTLREVRARIVRDLLQQYPPRGVCRWLDLIGWSPTSIERAFSDAAASTRRAEA